MRSGSGGQGAVPLRVVIAFPIRTGATLVRVAAALLAVTGAALGAVPARAQSTFGQEVRFICGYPAGSGADSIVRFFADRMKRHFDKPIIVENKPGAYSNIATEYVARAKPDGRTIYINGGTALAANMHLFRNSVDAGQAFLLIATSNPQPPMTTLGTGRPW